MEIIYSHHAQLRMLERAITREHVENVLDSPDVLLESSDGKTKASRRLGDKVYGVVFIKEGNKIIVVTVF